MPYLDNPRITEMADPEWAELFKVWVDNPNYAITRRGQKTSAPGKLKQLAAQAFYYGSALLPRDSSLIVDPPKGLVPYVRIPQELENMFPEA